MSIAKKDNEDEMILDSCGESLAEIWSRKNRPDFNKLRDLNEIALKIATAT